MKKVIIFISESNGKIYHRFVSGSQQYKSEEASETVDKNCKFSTGFLQRAFKFTEKNNNDKETMMFLLE